MAWSDYESSVCSIARSTQLLGDRWTVLVVRDLFNGVRRFDALQSHLGIARDILTKRLGNLVDAGLVERREYREEGARLRYEYALTSAGRELKPVLIALMDFGDAHLATEDGPPMALTHEECGAPVHVHLVCENGHEVDDESPMRLTPLAGASLR
jgi:DNA-binding HxlR family transcriptional regulator